jgi:hypothetical protein
MIIKLQTTVSFLFQQDSRMGEPLLQLFQTGCVLMQNLEYLAGRYLRS